MAYCNRKQVSRQLTDTGATLRSHFAQTGVNDRGGTYLDLLAIAFVRLGHGVILSQRERRTWYRHAVTCDVFVTIDAPDFFPARQLAADCHPNGHLQRFPARAVARSSSLPTRPDGA